MEGTEEKYAEEMYHRKNAALSAPGKNLTIEKIHPFDVYDLLHEAVVPDIVELGSIFEHQGKLYIQTTCVEPSPDCSLK